MAVDSRSNSRSDALWDGTKLYIASHRFVSSGGSAGYPILLYRYGYEPVTDTHSLDAGFPVTIGNHSTEALTIDKDSAGTLWAAWTQGLRVRIAHSLNADTQWSTPALLPTNTSDITSDDLCGLIHFHGDRTGVLWSDQAANTFFFSVHRDGDPDTVWSPPERSTDADSDDHLNLAAHSDGRVFFAGKNAANNVLLVVRTLDGKWSRYIVSASSPIMTRPMVLLDEQAGLIRVFATGQTTGPVFEKTSPIDNISFAAGLGTIRMRAGRSPRRSCGSGARTRATRAAPSSRPRARGARPRSPGRTGRPRPAASSRASAQSSSTPGSRSTSSRW